MTGEPIMSGGILDDAAASRRADPAGMAGEVARIPEQIRDAWRISRTLSLPASHTSAAAVAVLGMGGSAIGGDLVRSIWSDRLRVPVEVVRGYDLPGWAGAGSLVVASSYSGATEETLSAVEQAFTRRCPVAVITTGGPLGAVAERAGLPSLRFPGGGQPRAAVGYAVTLLAGLLERGGYLALPDEEIEAGAQAAEAALAAWGPDVPTERNLAKRLAWAMLDRLPVVEASGSLAAVARRWKTQLNENGKTMAVWEELPEANHNTVVGHPHPGTIRDHQLVVFLTSALDHPRNALRSRLSAALVADAGILHEEVRVEGATRFAQALSAIVLGDLVSVYLAYLYRADPTPVETIAGLKAALAAASRSDAAPGANGPS